MNALRRCIPVLAILLLPSCTGVQQKISEKEQKRKELNAQFDKLKLRKKRKFVVDRSEEFLKAPEGKPIAGEFAIAKVAPTVKLQILPNLKPEYFSGAQQYMACWANWGYVSRSEDNRFYVGASDHLAQGCQINIYEYRPSDNCVRKAVDVDRDLNE